MKINQNDLIISIVAIVLGIGFSVAFLFMKREVVAPQAPVPVNLTPAALPAPGVAYANSLPGASGAGGGMAGGGAMGMSGGMSMGGPARPGAPMGGGSSGAPSLPGGPNKGKG